MNKLMVTALNVGIASVLAVGLSACNRDASADGAAQQQAQAQAQAQAAAAQSAAQAATLAPAPVQQPTPAAAPPAGPKYAKVVSVDPVHETISKPRRICHEEVVSETAPPRDQHEIAGTAIGALAGGLLGHQVGHGSGRTLATVAGALGGGYAGRRIQESHQQGTVTSNTVERCSTQNDKSDKVVAYDVRYEYNGVVRSVRMDHDPGDRLEVQEGVVAVSDAR